MARRRNQFDRMIEGIDSELGACGIPHGYARLCGSLPLDAVITPETLWVAAGLAAQGHRTRPDTARFMDDRWASCCELANRVLEGRFKPTNYKSHRIRERGKQRIITPPTFESKVVQKTICALVVRPALAHHMISTSYAGIPGRGCALMRDNVKRDLDRGLRHGDCVAITFDYKNYFGSIVVAMLMEALSRYVTGDGVMDTVRLFFKDEIGCSLGNELSQVPASFYPSLVDHWMKSRLGIGWHRYMDDSLAICPSSMADTVVEDHLHLAGDLGLVLPEERVLVTPLGHTLAFCKTNYVYDSDRQAYVPLVDPRREARERKAVRGMIRRGRPVHEVKAQTSSAIGALAHEPHTHRMVARLTDYVGQAVPELVA